MAEVCHISTMMNWGGVERLLIDYYTYPQEKSFSPSLVTTSSILEIRELLDRAGIRTFQPKRSFRYDPSAVLQVAQWLRNEKVRLLHSHNSFSNVWGLLTANLANIEYKIAGEHGTVWWVKPPLSWFDNIAYRKANLVIANSNASSLMLKLRYGITPNKIKVIYNGVPKLPEVERDQIREQLGVGSKILIGSVGRLDTPKDYHTFIEAASIMKKYKQAIFMIVGGGAMEDELKDHIAELNLGGKFIITGWRDDARRLIQAFDIFVSTSIHESFGNSIVEASLAGIPIVAPRVDGIPEIVTHEITGYLLQPQNPLRKPRSPSATQVSEFVIIDNELRPPRSVSPKNLSETLMYLIENPDVRFRFGEAAKKRTEKLFTIDRYIENVELNYRKLLGE